MTRSCVFAHYDHAAVNIVWREFALLGKMHTMMELMEKVFRELLTDFIKQFIKAVNVYHRFSRLFPEELVESLAELAAYRNAQIYGGVVVALFYRAYCLPGDPDEVGQLLL
jgi:hypothetical protein